MLLQKATDCSPPVISPPTKVSFLQGVILLKPKYDHVTSLGKTLQRLLSVSGQGSIWSVSTLRAVPGDMPQNPVLGPSLFSLLKIACSTNLLDIQVSRNYYGWHKTVTFSKLEGCACTGRVVEGRRISLMGIILKFYI